MKDSVRARTVKYFIAVSRVVPFHTIPMRSADRHHQSDWTDRNSAGRLLIISFSTRGEM